MSQPPKVGLADALRQRELDDQEDRDSSTDANDEWNTPDSPVKKPAIPARRLVRPGEKAAADAAAASAAATKSQPAGSAEKRRQSDLSSGDLSSDKAKRACDAYDVDLAATEYGMCKCGFKKTDHVQSAAFRAAPRPLGAVYHPEPKAAPEKKPVMQPRSSSLASVPSIAAPVEEDQAEDDGKHPCEAFDVDLLAKEFGTCKCGFKKAAHSKAAQLAQPKKPSGAGFSSVQQAEKQAQEERQREQEEARRRQEQDARERQEFEERERQIRQSEEAESEHAPVSSPQTTSSKEVAAEEEPASEGPRACDSYEIDMNAKEFGACKCGFKKVDHAKASLFSKPLPKPVHAVAPIVVPNIGGSKSSNRAPPAFATSAKPAAPKPKEPEPSKPVVVVSEPEPKEEEPVVEEVAATEPEPEVEAETPMAEEPAVSDEPAPASSASTLLDPPVVYRALYDFAGEEAEDLNFSAGEEIEVLEILDEEWMRGRVGDRNGIFPSNFVAKRDEAVPAAAEAQPEPAAVEEEETAEVEEEQPAAAAVEEVSVAIQEDDDDVLAEEPAAVQEEAVAEPEPEPEVVAEEQPEPVVEETPVVEEEEAQDVAPVEEEAAAPLEEQETAPVEEEIAPVEEEEPIAEVAAVEEGEKEVPFFATALYDFTGETQDDLNFMAGDRIEVLAVVDSDWWRGTLNGHIGIFPANFVTREGDDAAPAAAAAAEEEPAAVESSAAGSLGFVEALYDMEEPSEGDLAFKTGDQIEIIEIIDDDWYRGALNGAEGLVPKNYVSVLGA